MKLPQLLTHIFIYNFYVYQYISFYKNFAYTRKCVRVSLFREISSLKIKFSLHSVATSAHFSPSTHVNEGTEPKCGWKRSLSLSASTRGVVSPENKTFINTHREIRFVKIMGCAVQRGISAALATIALKRLQPPSP